jgi:hypothetical protein
MIYFVTNLEMPCFRTPHPTITRFWVPESQVTQIYLSFSMDGRFTPPSSSSTEAFLSAGNGVVSDSDTYIERRWFLVC